MKRTVTAAIRLLLQAYDWVLQVIGKDLEGKARQQIASWLEQLRPRPGEEEKSLVGKLVDSVFGVASIRTDIDGWLGEASPNRPYCMRQPQK